MARSLTDHRSPPRRIAGRRAAGAAVAVVLAGFLLLGVTLNRSAPKVSEVTVVNPHPWTAVVKARAEGDRGWLVLGTVPRESESVFLETTDQGDRWVFAFSYGTTVVEEAVDRDDLEAAGWRLVIPDEFADALRAAGTFETPPGSG